MQNLKKSWKIIFIFLAFILFGNFLFPINSTSAGDGCIVAGGATIHARTIVIFYDSDSGRSWGVRATYHAHPSSMNVSGSSFTTSGRNLVIDCYIPESADTVEWGTACVDPNRYFDLDGQSFSCSGSSCTVEYRDSIDVDCHSIGYGGTPLKVYAGCGNNSGDWNRNFGYTASGAKCPVNSGYCVWGGLYYGSCNSNAYCGDGGNRCTRFGDSYCSSNGCKRNSNSNSSACIGQNGCCNSNDDCGGGKTCVSKNGAGYGVCDNRYKCNDNGSCTLTKGGNYSDQGNCNKQCQPADECNNNADCDSKVCGTGTNQCVRYNMKCDKSGANNKCVKDTSSVNNSNSSACGNQCPLGPDGLAATSSCNDTNASVTFRWNHVPNDTGYELYLKQDSQGAGAYKRYGGIIDPDPNSNVKNSFTKNDLAFNTKYDWYVIGRTSQPSNDPTVKSVVNKFTTTTKATCLGSITVTAYNDYDGDGFQDTKDSVAKNIKFKLNGISDATYKTGTNGKVTLSNLKANDYAVQITGLPTGWTVTTTNPVTKHILPPATQTINFGIQPPAPTCTGGSLKANPTSVKPGINSTLTATGCTTPTGDTPVYSWPVPDLGTTDNVNNPVTTWHSPNPYSAINTSAHPSVTVCSPGTNVAGTCRSYSATIAIGPVFSIGGNVYVDTDKDGYQNNGETAYTDDQTQVSLFTGTATSGTAKSISKNTTGKFSFTNLAPGTYTLVYTNKPQGYSMTFPTGAGNPKFTVVIGTGQCNNNNDGRTVKGHLCSAGNITKVNFGMNNANPWIQTGGSDIWLNSGISNPIPGGSTCDTHGAYMSIKINNSPGIVFSGPNTANFGGGQASADPYNWQVGGLTYPEPYTPVTPGIVRTSYNYITSLVQKNGFSTLPLTSIPGCSNLNNCQLPTTSTTFKNGVYLANGDLHLTSSNYTFPAGKNYVILIKGDLYLERNVHVPNGSTVLFTAGKSDDGSGGNIHVDESVGTNTIDDYDTMHIEGWYSADDSFYVDGESACPVADRRLNVAGAIVTNAALEGGGFVNNRDLCAGDATCPVFYIRERPDFILNAPAFLQIAPRIWQEVAP